MRRVGKFYITDEQVDQRPEEVRAIMGWCIVTGVTHDPYLFRRDYTAISDGFTEIADDAPIPRYTATHIPAEGIVQFYPAPPE